MFFSGTSYLQRCRVALTFFSTMLISMACQTSSSQPSQNYREDRELVSETSGYGLIPRAIERQFEEAVALSSKSATDESAVTVPLSLPQPGRYLGYVALPSQAAKAAAQMDLLLVQIEQDKISYQAIVKIFMGGFQSAEYVSTYFPDVIYTVNNQTFVFGKGGSLSFAMASSTTAGITGMLLHDQGEASGDIELRQQTSLAQGPEMVQDIFAGLPVLGTLSGDYAGQCADNVVGLTVEASKWRGSAGEQEDLFNGYRVSARLAQKDQVICGGAEPCVKANYNTATYNFLSGQLNLSSQTNSLVCRQQNKILDCDGCRLERHGFAMIPGREARYHLEARPAQLTVTGVSSDSATSSASNGLPPTEDTLNGQFFGYLHHEQSGKLQPMAVTLKATDDCGAACDLSGVATLYFGEANSTEFIAYKFAPTAYVHGKPFQILSGDGDGFFALREWNNGVLKGVWYSKVFGRVGTVELQRDQMPALAAILQPRLVKALAGIYGGSSWTYEIATTANVSESPADFYPLKLYGWAREAGVETRRSIIDEGSYDFYNDTLAFRLDDGRVVVGAVNADAAGAQSLLWPPRPRFGTVLGDRQPQLFRKQVSPEDAKGPHQAHLIEPTRNLDLRK